jgi:inner membrane protein
VVAALGDQVKGNLLTTPTPMNTLLWRILVLQEDHYLEGYYAVHKPEREIEFSRRELNIELLDQSNHIDSVQRLSWFTHGFMKANVIENQLTISDLRMGFEEVFVFTHAVAERDTTISWQPIKTRQLQTEFGIEAIKVVWDKL